MKKTFLAITALAAMLFAGCTSSDELTTLESIKTADNTPTPVQFGTYMGRVETRGGNGGDIIASTSGTYKSAEYVLNELGGFGVFAYHTEGTAWSNSQSSFASNFMYNQLVVATTSGAGTSESPYGVTNWTYTPIKYWPNEYSTSEVGGGATGANNYGKISFFAYAPYVEASDVSTGAVSANTYGITAFKGNTAMESPKVQYKLAPDGSSKFVDLLWGIQTKGATPAEDTYNTDMTKNDSRLVNDANASTANKDGKVRFLFKHALTKIAGSLGLKIVYDIDGIGTGETGAGSDDANSLVTVNSITIKNVKNKVIKEGWFDLATGDWTANNVTGESEDGSYINLNFTIAGTAPSIKLNTQIAEPTSLPTNDGSTGWKVSSESFDGVRAATAKNIYNAEADPIFLIPGDEDQQLKVTIDYNVRTYDNKLPSEGGMGATCEKHNQIITNTVTLPTSLLKSNKKITLVIHLGLTSVKFAAAVDSWEDVDGASAKEIYLPSNVTP